MVFVLDGETVERRAVEVGERRDGRAAILAGLVAGERVVMRASETLEDAQRVRVENEID